MSDTTVLRYQVIARSQNGGAPLFSVVDGHSGNDCSRLFHWRDDADALAKRLNAVDGADREGT